MQNDIIETLNRNQKQLCEIQKKIEEMHRMFFGMPKRTEINEKAKLDINLMKAQIILNSTKRNLNRN